LHTSQFELIKEYYYD